MKYTLEVAGNIERYLLDYQFNELLGSMVIKIDNQEVKRAVYLFGGPKKESLALTLGKNETVNVRIERERKFPFGHSSCVFVNERLVKRYEGV